MTLSYLLKNFHYFGYIINESHFCARDILNVILCVKARRSIWSKRQLLPNLSLSFRFVNTLIESLISLLWRCLVKVNDF